MKKIEFITKETKVVVSRTSKSSVNSSFVEIKKHKNLTFLEFIEKHFKNIKYGSLCDDFGLTSKRYPLNVLRKILENRDVTYEVSINSNRLILFPIIKTQMELKSFENEVSNYSLD